MLETTTREQASDSAYDGIVAILVAGLSDGTVRAWAEAHYPDVSETWDWHHGYYRHEAAKSLAKRALGRSRVA